MVNFRSGALVGMGIAVLGAVGWLAAAPSESSTTHAAKTFEAVPPASPDLSIPDDNTGTADAVVAARSERRTTFTIPEAATAINALTPIAGEPAAVADRGASTPEKLPEPVQVAQYVEGNLKQDCVVQFSTIPAVEGGVAVVQANRRLEITDVSNAAGVVTRTWTILGEDGLPLAGGENAAFTWENGSTLNPRPLPGGFGPTVGLTLDTPGNYTVQLQIVTTTGECSGNLAVTVVECVDPESATLEMSDLLSPNHGSLLPLHDWAPLGAISMIGTVNDDTGAVARRILGPFSYSIFQGPVFYDDINYENLSGPRRSDILEFGLVFDSGEEGEPDGVLDFLHDSLVITWANDGFPYGTVDESGGGLSYELDFFENGLELTGDLNPSPFTWPISSSGEVPFQYILVVRTSATWRSGTTLSYAMFSPFMVDLNMPRDPFNPGAYFVNIGCGEGAEPVDSYPDPNVLVPEDVQYSASFGAYDMTGSSGGGENPVHEFNRFGWTSFYFTPMGEHLRPRFDGVNQAFDMVLGEWMDLRSLFSLETWYPVVGLNAHSIGDAGLTEVNMIFTDIGADPDSPIQGNGGFDPRNGFEIMTGRGTSIGNDADTAVGQSYGFNGVWVYFDTNNNGVFDQPEKLEGGGVRFTDHPMIPRFGDSALGNLVDTYEPGWSYMPNPAWGGDPAWKMRMRFDGTRRRNPGAEPTGILEPTPDAIDDGRIAPPISSNVTEDYFVVIRADSGFQDISMRPGDGTGLQPAADFRAFVEPRNFNSDLLWYEQVGFGQLVPHQGGWDGGILISSQRPPAGQVLAPNEIIEPWQQDPLWSWPFPDDVHYHSQLGLTRNELRSIADSVNPEPWWPQRTHNWNNVKVQKGLIDVHDLVLLYDTNNQLAKDSLIEWTDGALNAFGQGFNFTLFDAWIDPFEEIINTFLDEHSVGVWHGIPEGTFSVGDLVAVITEDIWRDYQYSFETIPFFDDIFDRPPFGPRSSFYVPPHEQPTLPEYSTWPPAQAPALQLPPGEYPQLSDWPLSERRARLLKQHTDAQSAPVAILGFNVTGADDPITNRIAQTRLEEITVAFWGPTFTPSDLLPLDRNGEDINSGVLLYQDDGNGIFGGGLVHGVTFGGDSPVGLTNLAWRSVPEPVDLDGDGVADDINGDGIVDANDHCWILRLRPRNAWTLPISDVRQNNGDDLFLVVRTSESIKRFENFRAFVPSTLPSRTLSERVASIKIAPNVALPSSALVKQSPEENAVQDWYGHDMLESNVPAAIVDLVEEGAVISPIDEAPTAVLGIDVSTNRPYSEAQPFTSAGLGEGTRGNGTLTVPGSPFTAGALIGDFVIDSNYEPFEVTANTANTMTFLSGTPAPGPWILAREPSFLEQIIVEFYDEGNDGHFNLSEDLLLLNQEDLDASPPVLSGVSIYRDNDWHPDNRDGIFDPDIDIPIRLDDPPVRIGVPGEPQQQVKFVFSSPGTDNLAGDPSGPVQRSRADQPRLRQWVPDSWNEQDTPTQPAPGETPDFFVVVRASSLMQAGDDFRVGLVSWGPNTPTEPDPDQFTAPAPPRQPQDEFDTFSEFAWGARGLGFITYFKQQPFYHFWERTRDPNETSQFIRAARRHDNSGFNWVRTTVNKAVQTNVITASTDGANILITNVTPTELPQVVPAGGLEMRIDGRGFGGSPVVTIEGIQVAPDAASDNSITITIPAGTNFALPVVLTVQNSETGETATWTQFTIEGGGGLTILNVTPNQLPRVVPSGGIVLTITGFGFGNNPNVTFGDRTLQVQSASDTTITAVLPAGLDLTTVELILTVTNPTTGESGTFSGFEIVNIQLLTATPNVIPPLPPPSGINVRLGGTGFGNNPIVTFNGFNQPVIEASDTEILVSVVGFGAVIPGEFITVSVTNPNSNATATRDDLIRVGNLPADDVPTATLEISDGIEAAGKDGHALVPLADWVPLFHIAMTFDGETFAPRVLSKLRYAITSDGADERDWGRVAPPEVSDLLEFALFYNRGNEDDDFGSLTRLDSVYDSILVGTDGTPAVWDNRGAPIGRLVSDNQGFLEYEIDFIGTGTPANPQFPVVAVDAEAQLNYIVAVRTSATWRSMISMGFTVLSAEMVDPDGNFPRNDDGAPADSYTPDFFGEGENFDPDTGYSSSFAVWDTTGYTFGTWNPSFFNSWDWPQHMYTPAAEHIRPRWDATTNLVDYVSGEWLALRNVFSLESWTEVIGINIHSTPTVHVQDPLRLQPHHLQGLNRTPDYASMREVNLVFTDIGADPNAPPGSGGFDPRTMLDPLTPFESGPLDDNIAIGRDVSFNGAWIWHDTNNNGSFDPPTMVPPDQVGGITFNGDWPMTGLNNLQWEYVPFPPTGGDPWWKLRISLGSFRRFVAESFPDDFIEGSLEPIPDNFSPFDNQTTPSDYSPDYFVVFRADSGFQDASREPGDGSAMRPGADFRVFVEPRRFNPASGSTTGGIYVDSMIPGFGDFFGTGIGAAWQEDIRWGQDEPWWPQRTSNHNSAKPLRAMIDVHDLVVTYDSSSPNRVVTAIQLAGIASDNVCFGYADANNGGTLFDAWMDPFGLMQSQFLNRHAVTVPDDGEEFFIIDSFPTDDGGVINVVYNTDDPSEFRHYPYETVPFYTPDVDAPPAGPRAPQYPNPPAQPSLPEYATWPAHSEANVYPRASDWALEDRAARWLRQHVDTSSEHTAMLGINLAGVADPVANRLNQIKLSEINVAFWGPNFDPSKLLPLDSTGTLPTSGVMLWEDTNQNGVFEGRLFEGFFASAATLDSAVPLQNLAWRPNPEFVDLDGDGIADDMNGDGNVDDRDKAWVLTIRPQALWPIPDRDVNDFGGVLLWESCFAFLFDFDFKDADGQTPPNTVQVPYAPKDLDRTANNSGDDLFISVRTANTLQRFEQFRIVVPATLPERTAGQREAGIKLSPVLNVSPGAYEKLHPEEGPVQEFYGHDMLMANVPMELLDLTQANQTINNNGGVVPVLGLDISTNRENATLAEGANGTGGLRAFTVTNATWGPGAFVGHFLVDSNYEAFEITGNTANRLDLLSGAPANGRWRIVKDPTFLEQLIVEIYNESEEGTEDTDFNIATDLLPIVQDMTVSGIAIYRDNDNHPNNTNGQFDPGIDIPIRLDGPPQSISSATGPENQFLFVFSSPGTDNVPTAKENQLRLRQWVPDTFGPTNTSEFKGADFFVVVRASNNISVGDDFRIGIVGWGPNTPTLPDPDTFLPGGNANIMKEFDEFPWGSRAVGFITMLSEPMTNYYMEGTKTRMEPDASGFDFFRSGTSKKRRTFPIRGRKPPIGPNTIKIDSVSESRLPQAILSGDTFRLVINGDNFGTAPQVSIGGYEVTVDQATDEAINVSLRSIPGLVPQEPITLIVTNNATKETATRSDLFTLIAAPTNAPVVSSVSPNRGGSSVFPVTVRGSNFNSLPYLEVLFGTVKMDIVSATSTQIVVSFPRGGFPSTGPLNVTVRNLNTNYSTAGQHILVGAFTYQNGPSSGFGCSGSERGGPSADVWALGAAVAFALSLWRRKRFGSFN